MSDERPQRRLAAIVFSDLVDSTGLMARSEAEGLRAKERHRVRVRREVARYGGQFIEAAGDATLSIFDSALEAVSCGLAIQADTGNERDPGLHVGIHVGEVLLRGGEVHGDGVNIAARICALSEPGSVCVSGELFQAVRNQPHLEESALGERELKGVGRPIAIHALRGEPLPPAAARGRRRRTARRALLVGAGFFIVAVATWLAARLVFQPGPPPSTMGATVQAVAIFPFAFHGDASLEHLGEGMVNLLGIKLDGVAGLRRVDPHTLLSRVSTGERLDPERANRIAGELGAGQFILGQVLEAGGRLHLEASLYAGDRVLGQGSAEGTPEDLSSLVDHLAAEVLAAEYGRPGFRLAKLSTVTTDSFPALRAYLEGEREVRAVRYSEAVTSFRRAIAEDPDFSLAHFRLAWASLYRVPFELDVARAAIGRALEHRARLPERERHLVEAVAAYMEQRADEAERACRELLATHPDDWEAAYVLGDTYFHYNPFRGRSIFESVDPFELAFSLDPGNVRSRIHLAQLAAISGHSQAVNDHVAALVASRMEPSYRTAFRTLRVFSTGDPDERTEVFESLRSASDTAVLFAGLWVAPVDLEAGARIFALLGDPDRPKEVRVTGLGLAARYETGRGRWSAAKALLAAAESLDPDAARIWRAMFAAVVPGADADRRAALEDLARPPPTRPAGGPDIDQWNPFSGMHALLRSYMLGRLHAELGEGETALRYARGLADLDPPTGLERPGEILAAGVRASVAYREGRLRESLDALPENSFLGRGLHAELLYYPPYDQTHERFLRARILEEQGDPEAALNWYRSVSEAFPPSEYTGLGTLRRAEILEKLGRESEAVDLYRRLMTLWRDCDPEYEPLRERAAERLAALETSTASN